MTATNVLTAVCAALGSAGLFTFLQFLIDRRDRKKDRFGKIEKKLDKLEKDGCRTQLLIMLSDYPENTKEIMELAQHYFSDLRGNWYMSAVFEGWMKAQGVRVPDWYAKGGGNR